MDLSNQSYENGIKCDRYIKNDKNIKSGINETKENSFTYLMSRGKFLQNNRKKLSCVRRTSSSTSRFNNSEIIFSYDESLDKLTSKVIDIHNIVDLINF